MADVVAQMSPMPVLAALIVGWTTEALWPTGGYGLIRDMLIGVAGSVLLGAGLSIVAGVDVGMMTMFVVGLAGAAIGIAAQRMLWRSGRSKA